MFGLTLLSSSSIYKQFRVIVNIGKGVVRKGQIENII
jgi:hypothetical protein